MNVNYFFLGICVSWPGKVHDAGLFKNSSPLQWCPQKDYSVYIGVRVPHPVLS